MISKHGIHGSWIAAMAAIFFLAVMPGCGESDKEDNGPSQISPVEPKLEQRGNYTIVWLKGTPYEMGFQQGEMLHDVIKEGMEFVEADPQLSSIPLLAEALGLIELAENNSYQDVLDECRGLVDATADVGFTMEFCLILNFGDVILEFITGMPDERKFDGPGCSQVISVGEAAPDGRLYHARNLDWGSMDISVIHSHLVIFVRQPSDGVPHVGVGFPLNICTYTGMNMERITCCSNEADPVDSSEQSLTGRSHVQMLHHVLKNAKSLEEATEFIEGEEHMSAEILVISDGEAKDGAVFEMTGKHIKIRKPENGVVYVTNHFVSPEMEDLDAPQDPEAVLAGEEVDSSLLRFWRLEELVEPDGEETLYGGLDTDGLATVMRDRVNPVTDAAAPYDDESIDNDAGLATNGPMHFVLFDPAKRLFWVMAGKDPENGKPYVSQQPYTCFSMEELLAYPDPTPCEPEQF